MSDFKKGDRVNIAINDALVLNAGSTSIIVEYVDWSAEENGDETRSRIAVSTLEGAAVTVERIDPDAPKVQPGATYRDGRGVTWFAVENFEDEAYLRNEADQAFFAHDLIRMTGSLTRVHRDGTETPQAEPEMDIDIRDGDLYEDVEGSLWFVVDDDVVALAGDDSQFSEYSDMLKYRPLTRVYRAGS